MFVTWTLVMQLWFEDQSFRDHINLYQIIISIYFYIIILLLLNVVEYYVTMFLFVSCILKLARL